MSYEFVPIQISKADDETFIVHIGCRTFTFPDVDSLVSAFSKYVNNPIGTHMDYAKRYGWPSALPQDAMEQRAQVRVARGRGEEGNIAKAFASRPAGSVGEEEEG